MIEKINAILNAIKELIKSHPEDPFVIELQKWVRRLHQYKEFKKIEQERELTSEEKND